MERARAQESRAIASCAKTRPSAFHRGFGAPQGTRVVPSRSRRFPLVLMASWIRSSGRFAHPDDLGLSLCGQEWEADPESPWTTGPHPPRRTRQSITQEQRHQRRGLPDGYTRTAARRVAVVTLLAPLRPPSTLHLGDPRLPLRAETLLARAVSTPVGAADLGTL